MTRPILAHFFPKTQPLICARSFITKHGASLRALALCLGVMQILLPSPAAAWDETGHRLSASVALRYLNFDTQRELLTLLQQHPRYQQDFIDKMPSELVDAPPERQLSWLLGQAAYWPDIARGFNDSEREKYSRPSWHYIDGAWLRDSAKVQGNVYVNRPPAPEILGLAGSAITSERDADNVVTALDYNTRILANDEADAAQRAVALCWVLHLIGDIHQPLHSGSLYSAELFATGDRGGNAIRIGESNLHSIWDRAMRGADRQSRSLLYAATYEDLSGRESDWTLWLAESREILVPSVYNDALLGAIRSADSSGAERLPSQVLSDDYVAEMVSIASDRLGLAGLRLAIWFQNELPAAAPILSREPD